MYHACTGPVRDWSTYVISQGIRIGTESGHDRWQRGGQGLGLMSEKSNTKQGSSPLPSMTYRRTSWDRARGWSERSHRGRDNGTRRGSAGNGRSSWAFEERRLPQTWQRIRPDKSVPIADRCRTLRTASFLVRLRCRRWPSHMISLKTKRDDLDFNDLKRT